MEGGSAHMRDVSNEQQRMITGLTFGDKHSYLCLLDIDNGEVLEEGNSGGEVAKAKRLPAGPSGEELAEFVNGELVKRNEKKTAK